MRGRCLWVGTVPHPAAGRPAYPLRGRGADLTRQSARFSRQSPPHVSRLAHHLLHPRSCTAAARPTATSLARLQSDPGHVGHFANPIISPRRRRPDTRRPGVALVLSAARARRRVRTAKPAVSRRGEQATRWPQPEALTGVVAGWNKHASRHLACVPALVSPSPPVTPTACGPAHSCHKLLIRGHARPPLATVGAGAGSGLAEVAAAGRSRPVPPVPRRRPRRAGPRLPPRSVAAGAQRAWPCGVAGAACKSAPPSRAPDNTPPTLAAPPASKYWPPTSPCSVLPRTLHNVHALEAMGVWARQAVGGHPDHVAVVLARLRRCSRDGLVAAEAGPMHVSVTPCFSGPQVL